MKTFLNNMEILLAQTWLEEQGIKFESIVRVLFGSETVIGRHGGSHEIPTCIISFTSKQLVEDWNDDAEPTTWFDRGLKRLGASGYETKENDNVWHREIPVGYVLHFLFQEIN